MPLVMWLALSAGVDGSDGTIKVQGRKVGGLAL
ncbi:hypothetical protein MCEMAEM21_00283 [Oxalobacteraceae bacterium]|jgi:hypothetical protein